MICNMKPCNITSRSLITAQLSESNKTTARGRRESMVVGFTTTYMQSGPITTNFVSLNPTQAIQHYVIKFVSNLGQVGGFLRFPPPIKLTATI
jgi:hypothetical protein